MPDTQDVSGRERGLACPTPHCYACVFRANFYQIDPSPAGMGFLSIQPPFTRAVRRVAGPISRQRLLHVLGVAPEKRQPLFSYIPSNFAQRSYFPFISKRRRFRFALLKYGVLGFVFTASGPTLRSLESLLQH